MNHTTLTITLELQSTRKLRMTRKILITLCTLLAVGSGEYTQAGYREVKTSEKGKTEGKGARKSGEKVDQPKSEQQKAIETQVDILNKQESAQKYAKSASKTSTVSLDNEGNGAGDTFVKQILNVSDVSEIFDLKPEDGDQISNSPGQGDNSFNTHTLTRKDGSTYTIKADRKDGIIKQMIETKKNKDNGTEESTTYSKLDGTSKPSFTSFVRETKGQSNTLSSLTSDETGVTKLTYDPKVSRINPSAKIEFKFNQDGALVDSDGNSITRETVQSMDATEKASTKAEFKTQVTEAVNANSEAVEAARTQAEALAANPEKVGEFAQEMVDAIAPKDATPEEKTSVYNKIRESMNSMLSSGAEGLRSIANVIIDAVRNPMGVWDRFTKTETTVTSPEMRQAAGPTGSATGENASGNKGFSLAAPDKSIVYASDAAPVPPVSPTGIDAVDSLNGTPEGPNLFAAKPEKGMTQAERLNGPKDNIGRMFDTSNGASGTPQVQPTSSPLLKVN